MKIDSLRLAGIRCFDDTGWIELSPRCNIFVGQNNAGKSTLLRGILAWQGFPFIENEMSGDIRPGASNVTYEMGIREVEPRTRNRLGEQLATNFTVCRHIRGNRKSRDQVRDYHVGGGSGLFFNERPYHQLVPFVARRKAVQFNQQVNRDAINQINGTFQNLYSRIDLIASAGHPKNVAFQAAIKEIVGLDIATLASESGKEAGFYFDDDHFVPLDRMGDGVSEMVALIVEMCLERDKIFVLEEPETNLHPKGLKALLNMVRKSSEQNQFIIATHSNIVVRELAVDGETRVFRVNRVGDERNAPSRVEEISNDPMARIELLRELGYEFADFEMHEGWLFLEEASAESVFRSVLIPLFAPELFGRLRTFSAKGVTNVGPSVEEFKRLITFVHLEPVYRGRLWARVDNDEDGKRTVEHLRATFDHFDEWHVDMFQEANFEKYYPARFQDKVDEALALDKKARNVAKDVLRREVLEWSRGNAAEARAEWAESAKEQIELLREISRALGTSRMKA